jgi:hypothetical protein
MENLKKLKIRQKKPKDSIKQKTPRDPSLPKIRSKVPNDSKDSFALPPQKTQTRKKIPKNVVKLPSDEGSQKRLDKSKKSINQPPPFKTYQSKKKQIKHLNSSGKIAIKEKSPGKSPPKYSTKNYRQLPSRKGAVSSKKIAKTVNKPPSKKIISKTPKKLKNRIPPSTFGMKIKKPLKQTNRAPSQKIVEKTPAEKKSILPPTINLPSEKIPKTKIKGKKPK